jgi:hypothetical protein
VGITAFVLVSPGWDEQTRLLPGKGDGIGRARRLLDNARDKSSYRDGEGVQLRSVVLENLFESAHESILKQRLAFRDLIEDYEGLPDAAKRTISVDLECFRCGEMLLVKGGVVPPRKSLSKSKHDVSGPEDNSPSPVDFEELRKANKLKWTSDGSLTVRPMLLLPPEAAHVYEVAVVYFIKALGQSELDIRNKPKWKLVSEYVVQAVRLASCGAARRPDLTATQKQNERALSIVSNVRLILPFVEYRRQERNA